MLLSPKLFEYAKKIKNKLMMIHPDRENWEDQIIEIP